MATAKETADRSLMAWRELRSRYERGEKIDGRNVRALADAVRNAAREERLALGLLVPDKAERQHLIDDASGHQEDPHMRFDDYRHNEPADYRDPCNK